jgi:hypothetical protein
VRRARVGIFVFTRLRAAPASRGVTRITTPSARRFEREVDGSSRAACEAARAGACCAASGVQRLEPLTVIAIVAQLPCQCACRRAYRLHSNVMRRAIRCAFRRADLA